MGLCSHYGLLVMLLFHLCRAQDDALPSPEPAPPSLGEVIDAVKAAFEKAVQISTTGVVREALEQAVGELTPQKTLEDHSPDHTEETAEDQAAVLSTEKPDVHMSESSELTYKEQSQEGLTQDIAPSEAIKGLIAQDESSISEPEESSVIKPAEVVLEAIDSVQEQLESVVQDSQIVEVSEGMTGEINSEESPAKAYADTQKESKSGAMEMNEDEEGAGELGQGLIKEEAQLSEIEERTAKGKIEEVEVTIGGEIKAEGPQEEESVEMQEGNTESEPSQEERQAVTAQMGTDGGVVDMDEVEEEEQEAAKAEEGVIEVEAKREQIEARSDSQLLKEEEVHPANKTVREKTQQQSEVAVDTKGPIKLQEPVITKSKATGGEAGKTHETSDVNEIITSRDPDTNDQGEPVLRNTVEELPLTPVLKLRLGETDETSVEGDADSTQTKDIGQKAWKIGAIAAAFFLILQTAVTIVYILKCRRKPNRSVAPKNPCAGGNEGIECDANNTDTTIPIDEQSAADDLPEYSQVQQEDVAMTTIPPDSTEKNSSRDPRPSVV